MKSAMIAAALCAALTLSAPVAVQAKGMSNMTDTQVYCTFFPYMAKCAPAKPAAAKPAAAVKPAKAVAKPTLVASAKPAKASPHIKTMACNKAEAGKPYLYSCSWK